jgi:tetratricopeptide (TPR) repeat protein
MVAPFADDTTYQLRELVRTGRFSEALERYRRVEASPAGRRPDAQLLAATAATRLGEFPAAESLAGEALFQFRTRGDADGRMRSLNLLGVIRFERGRLGEAEQSLAEALNLATQLGDTLTAARACNNLASAIHLRGRPDEALGLYRGALLAYQRLGDRRGTAEAYHNLGLIYRQLGEWRNAEDATDEALRHAELVGERGLLALATTGRAELMAERAHLAQARQELDRAGRWAAEAGDEVGSAEVERVRALVAYKEGDLEAALGHAEAARAAARAFDSAVLAAECASLAALALKRLGRLAEAEERRAEAEVGFRSLGALRLLERLADDWRAIPAKRRPSGPRAREGRGESS